MFYFNALYYAHHIDSPLGTFLLQNYKQALDIQLKVTKDLEVFEYQTGFGAPDFLNWHQEETAFLSVAKRKEPEEMTLKVSYVEAMEKLYKIE